LGENDWFSVVKVSTVWDSNVSDERLIYFIWNSFQTNTGKLDSFYRNNYYTFHEVYNNLTTDYLDELKRQGKDNTELRQISKDLMDYYTRVKRFLYQMKKYYPWPITILMSSSKVDLDDITKEQLLRIHKNIMEARHKEDYINIKRKIKREVDQIVKILSKRNPKLNYPLTVTIDEVFMENSDYLIDFKRWLATKVK
tara:strand:+ start:545 stop:1135 length:591 start_codon:yes stop_codon:yes gene_type:complete